ncbi:hypothetical protein J2S10_001191 [Neobacillus ginsengisoli]|uniref:Uncharacterized protein n=1 Tax=Neobacillus ginsengisoli TaxID=904295 RepID=A0ABT9XR66_9BACI|nr:hypothetical protein [Neobacillus ginsengisoli]
MNQKLIQVIHIYILMIIFSGFMVHVLCLPALLTFAKRDAWISAIFSSIPVIFTKNLSQNIGYCFLSFISNLTIKSKKAA